MAAPRNIADVPQRIPPPLPGDMRSRSPALLPRVPMHAALQVHVVAHSMGARVLAGVSQRIADIFAPSPLATEPRRSAVPPRYSREEFDLGSVIMLSPDMDLGEFAGHTGPLLRSVCDNVVIYGDEHDSALNIASICNRYLFKWWPGLAMPNLAEHWCAVLRCVCPSASAHAVRSSLSLLDSHTRCRCPPPRNMCNNLLGLSLMPVHRGAAVAGGCLQPQCKAGSSSPWPAALPHGSLFRAAGQTGGAEMLTEDGVACSAKLGVPLGASLGRHCRPVPQVGGGVLDVDVVVTSHLQSNIHGIGNKSFHLNNEIVCDLRDVIVHGNRARDRVSRLEPTAHNTYSFLVAPPYVVAA